MVNSSWFVRQRHKENTKVVKYICAIMVAFSFCILPMFVYGILYYFVWKWKVPCNMDQFGFTAHVVLFSNATFFLVINFVFNGRYRKGLKYVLNTLKFMSQRYRDKFKPRGVRVE